MKTRTSFAAMLLLVPILILGGCARPEMTAKEAPLVDDKELNFLHTPVEALGMRVTENLERGRTFTVAGWFPEFAFCEEYPGRVSWKGWGANLETGREFFAQVARAGVYKSGEFISYFTSDDDSVEAMEGRGVMLSSDLSFVADLGGGVFPLDAKQWRFSKEYRLEIMRRHGSLLKNFKVVEGFEQSVLKWSRYALKDEEADIMLPYKEEDLRKINSINPGYSLMEKIALKGNLTIYPLDPVATTSNLALNMIIASNMKPQGWDYSSEYPSRAVSGLVYEYVAKFRLELIRKLNEKNKDKNQDRGYARRE